ncbi:alanine racemase, partial [Alphaproteobacteria bacterium]|nr:alanine racemase [Alphaproteobacteria bacterium]
MINPNAILEINSKNLIENYITISKYTKKSLTGAVIKANAYGLGDIEIYKDLYKAGCRNFFLATLNEAINIRKKYLSSNIYVLNGLENNKISKFYDYNVIPIINSIEELELYLNNKYFDKNKKIGLQIDTGLNRLGIHIKELINIDLK